MRHLLLATLNFVLAVSQLTASKKLTLDSSRVVVIGGGVSGLAAASELIKNGFTHVTILEAQDRLGGRIHTIPHG